MIEPRKLRTDAENIVEMLIKRGYEEKEARDLVNEAVQWDQKRRNLQVEVDTIRSRINRISSDIAVLKRKGEDATQLIRESQKLGNNLKKLEENLRKAEEKFREALLSIPNIPHSSVPEGQSSEDNPVYRAWGKKPEPDFQPLQHDEIGEKLGILDFKRGAKIASSGFTVCWGAGALLERALINFMLDLHVKEHGYTEVLPTFLVNRDSMTGTGQLPKFGEDMYHIPEDNLYLIPTAEVPVTNLHRDEILDEETLPRKYVAYSPCFRREAGSYGAHTRGLIRQHQFNKVELVKFTRPEDSYQELETLLEDAEDVLKRLGLHYRVVTLCTGDLGFSAAKTYDIEVYLPSRDEYLEISSVSNFEDYQARRAMIRCRAGRNKPRYLHTLNGSGLAIGRTVVAILDNYQQKDGSVKIPDALIPYMNGIEVLEPAR